MARREKGREEGKKGKDWGNWGGVGKIKRWKRHRKVIKMVTQDGQEYLRKLRYTGREEGDVGREMRGKWQQRLRWRGKQVETDGRVAGL